MDREKPIKLAHQAAVEHQLQIQQRARILKGIELGERAIREGRVVSHEAARRRMLSK